MLNTKTNAINGRKTLQAAGLIMITVLLAAAAAQTSFASEGPGTEPLFSPATVTIEREDPSEMSVEDIIRSLYAREKDPDVRQCAIDSSMIMTGEAPVVDYMGYIKVGSYSSATVWNLHNIAMPLGQYEPKGSRKDGYTIVYQQADYPTEERAAYNRECLNYLYDTAWDLKEQTAGMSAEEKVAVICEYLNENVSKRLEKPGRIATCMMEQAADCDGLAGLFYVIGQHCGLDVKDCLGYEEGTLHNWCMVNLDGSWKIVDVALGNYPDHFEYPTEYQLVYSN